jgi:hypothetical protein
MEGRKEGRKKAKGTKDVGSKPWHVNDNVAMTT